MRDLLPVIGLWSLAVGALSGFAMVLVVDKPQWLHKVGIKHHRRVFQTHLDWILMGLLLIAVGLVATDTPAWVLVLVTIGAIVNPLLFVPLAFEEKIQETLVYRTASGLSFVSLSAGLVAVAIAQTIAY
ncbi:hypothetical protein ASG12_19825 [Williamsia sp. Leaf354]|jgi:hydroxylaminobenzene mutase|uniref:hypothetical protein n=1 Tax=Williamsia sp. Leaf354 TaxID=1736349 RepID=UPI0006FC63E6|nr:hypothetical protein [Williamsia sp. Leaf354]KQR96409.1 hypothetical protein ASG12_19825 [Williamsia sp. Leaf354]